VSDMAILRHLVDEIAILLDLILVVSFLPTSRSPVTRRENWLF